MRWEQFLKKFKEFSKNILRTDSYILWHSHAQLFKEISLPPPVSVHTLVFFFWFFLNLFRCLRLQVAILEAAINEKKRQVEKLVTDMKEANLQSLAASPPEELKIILEGIVYLFRYVLDARTLILPRNKISSGTWKLTRRAGIEEGSTPSNKNNEL